MQTHEISLEFDEDNSVFYSELVFRVLGCPVLYDDDDLFENDVLYDILGSVEDEGLEFQLHPVYPAFYRDSRFRNLIRECTLGDTFILSGIRYLLERGEDSYPQIVPYTEPPPPSPFW